MSDVEQDVYDVRAAVLQRVVALLQNRIKKMARFCYSVQNIFRGKTKKSFSFEKY